MICEVCGGEDFSIEDERDNQGEGWMIYVCNCIVTENDQEFYCGNIERVYHEPKEENGWKMMKLKKEHEL